MSDSDEGDVEPDNVAPGAATYPVSVPLSSHEIVRSIVEAVSGPESMSAEPAGSVPVPTTPASEEKPSSGGRARYTRICRSPPSGDSSVMPRQSCRSDHTSQRTGEFQAGH